MDPPSKKYPQSPGVTPTIQEIADIFWQRTEKYLINVEAAKKFRNDGAYSLMEKDSHQFNTALIPGRVMPSRYSSIAPPPVDT